jgi:phosphohistidine phosphatase
LTKEDKTVAVYLMQHGKPVPKAENPEKPLSSQGIRDVESLAEFLKEMDIGFRKIFHSGKRRAKETAEIMGRLSPGRAEERQGLSPMDDVGEIARQINEEEGDLFIAGHLPHLAKLTSLLITGDETVPVVNFQQGGMVCLEKHEAEGWTVSWMLVPSIIGEGI